MKLLVKAAMGALALGSVAFAAEPAAAQVGFGFSIGTPYYGGYYGSPYYGGSYYGYRSYRPYYRSYYPRYRYGYRRPYRRYGYGYRGYYGY